MKAGVDSEGCVCVCVCVRTLMWDYNRDNEAVITLITDHSSSISLTFY
jgi:hypothetical protein